jgi:tetratricopeptide (TPR) repeat protein
MKRSERHHLKQNTLAVYFDRASTVLAERGREIGIAILVLLVLGLAIAGYTYWRGQVEARASALLAEAMIILESPVEPPPLTAPGEAPTAPTTFATEQARLEAALPKFTEVYAQYPSAPSATTARYHAANALSVLGRTGEAEALYQEVASGRGIYADMARLGLANQFAIAGEHDRAIELYTELADDRDGRVPIDGVLMQLGRAYARAGRHSEAQQTYSRLVQEFPDSLYVAEARRELEGLGKT